MPVSTAIPQNKTQPLVLGQYIDNTTNNNIPLVSSSLTGWSFTPKCVIAWDTEEGPPAVLRTLKDNTLEGHP
jgi:hypothetical protein